MMSKTILVIDDSTSFRTVVKLALQKAGYTVQEAGDGQEAVDKLPTAKPNLIVCDVNMPRMDGLTFARHVRNHPVHKKEEGKAAGVRAWITKPFQPSQLVDAVKRLCP
jgi:two-component system chemotaxis response regulator CheY